MTYVDPGDYLPILGVLLLGSTTAVGIAGAWAVGRMRGMRDASKEQVREADTHARLERMERSLEQISEEIERLGEVQRFALKVIGDKAISQSEPAKLPQGRVITPH
jgi:hypothetical protein